MAATESMPPSVHAGALSSAILRVARLHRALAGQLLREVGLHPGQELVMMQLWDRGPQRQVDLVRMLASDAATMTRTIQRLERAGFVRRSLSETDRRVTIVEATPASMGVRRQVDALWSRLEDVTAGDLGEEDRAEVVRLLDRIEANLAPAVELHPAR